MKQMEKVISQLKGGNFDAAESGKMLAEGDSLNLRSDIEKSQRLIDDLQKENSKLRADTEKAQQS